MASHPDPEQVQVLRHDTHELSERLDALAVQLMDGSLIPADLSAEYNGQLRHEVLALAFAMVAYLPRNDPRVIVVVNGVAPGEGPTIAASLQDYDAHTAAVQLRTISSILSKLANSLPSEPINP